MNLFKLYHSINIRIQDILWFGYFIDPRGGTVFFLGPKLDLQITEKISNFFE